MPEGPPEPPVPGRKLRHALTKRQRFERAMARMPGKNPVLPVLMHSIERYLQGVRNPSDVDTITRNFFLNILPVPRAVLQSWVTEWNAVPEPVKRKIVPGYLHTLSPDKRLTLAALRKNPQDDSGSRNHGATISEISPRDPDGKPSLCPGQLFILSGKGFSPVAGENTVLIANVVGKELRPVTRIFPEKSTLFTLEAYAPPGLADGMYGLSVAVEGKPVSSIVRVAVKGSVDPGPVISSVSPGAQYPGKTIVIGGDNFGAGLRVWWRSLGEGISARDLCSDRVELTARNKIAMVDVPDDFVKFPGDYMIALSGSRPGRSIWWQTFRIKPFRYRVEFTEMRCVDDLRDGLQGPDQLVTRWMIYRDGTTWIKQSRNYTGFDDGPVKEYFQKDRRIFMTDCSAGEVRSQLGISTQLYAWDAKHAKAWEEPLGKIGEWIREIDGWEWEQSAASALGFIISWLDGDPVILGSNVTRWTAKELMEKTGNDTKSFSGTMDLFNSDGTGSITLAYTVFRVED